MNFLLQSKMNTPLDVRVMPGFLILTAREPALPSDGVNRDDQQTTGLKR
jgi:hypothetical protein